MTGSQVTGGRQIRLGARRKGIGFAGQEYCTQGTRETRNGHGWALRLEWKM